MTLAMCARRKKWPLLYGTLGEDSSRKFFELTSRPSLRELRTRQHQTHQFFPGYTLARSVRLSSRCTGVKKRSVYVFSKRQLSLDDSKR